MKQIYKIITILVLFNYSLIAQINIESAKLHKLIEGFSGKGEAFYNFSDGNTKQYKIGSLLKVDYLTKDYETFVMLNYEKSSANNELVSNSGYLHLRLMINLHTALTSEIFAQREFNDFTKLKSRSLIGTGLRLEPLHNLFNHDSINYNFSIGSGLMFENELIIDSLKPETNLIRSTNYINFQWKPAYHTKLMSITYFQFDINNFQDYRILNNTSLIMSLTKYIKVFISAVYRFDNQAPNSVKNFDFEMKNGIALEF